MTVRTKAPEVFASGQSGRPFQLTVCSREMEQQKLSPSFLKRAADGIRLSENRVSQSKNLFEAPCVFP